MEQRSIELEATGIPGLDDVLGGGLPSRRVYLVEGDPGSGKTTLAMQFLYEGARLGQAGLYLGLSETQGELEQIIASHGWEPAPFQLLELHPSDESLAPESQYTIFHPSEVELGVTTKRIIEAIETNKPQRVVLDSLSEMRLLAQSTFRFRRQIVALKHYLMEHGCTAILLDDRSPANSDSPVHTLAHGVITLDHLAPEYGNERRHLRVAKLRGQRSLGGYNDLRIDTGGISVYPRLIVSDHRPGFSPRQLQSGVPELDELLGGGLDYGTSALLIGPTGCGKSTVACHFAMAAASAGERAAIFTFDETDTTFIRRNEGLGLRVADAIASGHLFLRQVDPAQLSPGEFACLVLEQVDLGAKVVAIDSLNGYLHAMSNEHSLIAQLHELLTCLNQQGVVTLILMAQAGILGPTMQSPVDASYLSDTVLLFRYFEAFGQVHKALSVLKRRTGGHETSIRKLSISNSGIGVGGPLTEFSGVLTGTPRYLGGEGALNASG